MSGTDTLSWDECLDAEMTASEAARARGTTISAACVAARRRGRSWKVVSAKLSDQELRKMAKRNATIREITEAFGIVNSTAYHRVRRLRGIEFHEGRLWTSIALKKAQADGVARKRAQEDQAEREKVERAEEDAARKARAARWAAAARDAAAKASARKNSGARLSASPAAIERYFAKGGQARRRVAC